MHTAYLDAFSGLSGDMLLGALIDAGVEFARLEQALRTLKLTGYRVSVERRTLNGISAVKFNVEVLEPQEERRLSEIAAIIERSALSVSTKETALKVFKALAEAEAKVHRVTPERVHFHEVGAVDSIIDIVGAAWSLAELRIGKVLVSALPMGSGLVSTRHGVMPVPAPATAELLAGYPVRIGDGEAEMVTPTGAAIVKALARAAPIPLGFAVEQIGYGAGSKVFADRPNLLRVMIGAERAELPSDELIEIQTNIDDLNPQIYDHLCERLLDAGARDVTLTPTIMKKGRPGVTVSVLAEPASRDKIAAVLFGESTTIGLRYHPVSRLKLSRELKQVDTSWGKIGIKVSRGPGDAVNYSPEFEDCRRAALAHGVALKRVMQDAQAAALRELK